MRWSNQPDAGWYGMASVAVLLAWSWPSSDRRSSLPQGSQEWHLVEHWPASTMSSGCDLIKTEAVYQVAGDLANGATNF